MKRKILALLMASVMAMTMPGQAVMASAAEFSDASGAESNVTEAFTDAAAPEEVLPQEAVPETLPQEEAAPEEVPLQEETAPEESQAEAVPEAVPEEIPLAEETETETAEPEAAPEKIQDVTGEIPGEAEAIMEAEAEEITSDVFDAGTDVAEVNGEAYFVEENAYINWMTGENPDIIPEGTSPSAEKAVNETWTKFLERIQEQVGYSEYVMLRTSGTETEFEKILIPEGMRAGFMECSVPWRLSGIITDENSKASAAFVSGEVETPSGILEINTKVGFCRATVRGDICGTDSDIRHETAFLNWNNIGGLHKVEWCGVGQNADINVISGGSVEFGEILMLDLGTGLNGSWNIHVDASQGFPEKPAVTFHHAESMAAWGNEYSNGTEMQGNPAGVNISFVETIFPGEGTENFTKIEPEAGTKVVSFGEIPISDVLNIMDSRVRVDCGEGKRVDVDGSVFEDSAEKHPFYMEEEEKEVLTADGKVYTAGTLENAFRIMEALKWERVWLYLETGFDGKIELPETSPVKYLHVEQQYYSTEVPDTRDSSRNTVQITAVHVPEGKEIELYGIVVTSGQEAADMEVTGNGILKVKNGRMNQRIHAEGTVWVENSSAKALDCGHLIVDELWIAAEELLTFESAEFSHARIFLSNHALFKMGTVNNIDENNPGANSYVMCERDAQGNTAQIFLEGALELGEDYKGNKCWMEISFVDQALYPENRPESFMQDWYSESFEIFGTKLVGYVGMVKENACLMTVSTAAEKSLNENGWPVLFYGLDAETGEEHYYRTQSSLPGEFPEPEITADGKYMLGHEAIIDNEEKFEKHTSYIQAGISMSDSVIIAPVPDQSYTGEALTRR